MSLFENEQYQWRETYLILFRAEDRPAADEVEQVLTSLGPQYQVSGMRVDKDGRFDSLTLFSPDDYAAMDISYVAGEEVTEQTLELVKDVKTDALTKGEKARLKQLLEMDARFDIYHFEEIVSGDEEDDEFMDPGCLLQVMERLTKLVDGIGIDPAASSLL
jgi:hypothetical protein